MVDKLIQAKESGRYGQIAAVDPQTGKAYYGKNVVEASKIGRKQKRDPKAVFFFVRVGHPSVHVLKSIALQGHIERDFFPKIKGYIQNKTVNLVSSISDDNQSFDLIADTGFSGSIVLDLTVIDQINTDYIGVDTVTLAGGVECPVGVHVGKVMINETILSEVEITEMEGEYLIGVELMRTFCRMVVFDFDDDKIYFEE